MFEGIELRLDEANELVFDVNIAGTDIPPAPPIYRFVCESDDMYFAFKGIQKDDNKILVTVPPLKQTLDEGTYNSKLEVLIDDRYFVPLETMVTFKSSLKVTAEAVMVNKRITDDVDKADLQVVQEEKTTAKLVTLRNKSVQKKKKKKAVVNTKQKSAHTKQKKKYMTLKEKYNKK